MQKIIADDEKHFTLNNVTFNYVVIGTIFSYDIIQKNLENEDHISKIYKNENYSVSYKNDMDCIQQIVDTINSLFDVIRPMYVSNELIYANKCGDNVQNVGKMLNKVIVGNYKIGQIIITDWNNKITKFELDQIEKVFGTTLMVINANYHALVYIEITINEQTYFIAIETVIYNPYSLQFYIGLTKEQLSEILKTRYLCKKYIVTYDCNKQWMDIVNDGF
jgi:hypothetical protein